MQILHRIVEIRGVTYLQTSQKFYTMNTYPVEPGAATAPVPTGDEVTADCRSPENSANNL
jgi:hypothetical protein